MAFFGGNLQEHSCRIAEKSASRCMLPAMPEGVRGINLYATSLRQTGQRTVSERSIQWHLKGQF
jgi:hypothetical protein